MSCSGYWLFGKFEKEINGCKLRVVLADAYVDYWAEWIEM